MKLISYEEALREAEATPDMVEKSWLLESMKQPGPMQNKLLDLTAQKLRAMGAPQIAQWVDDTRMRQMC